MLSTIYNNLEIIIYSREVLPHSEGIQKITEY